MSSLPDLKPLLTILLCAAAACLGVGTLLVWVVCIMARIVNLGETERVSPYEIWERFRR